MDMLQHKRNSPDDYEDIETTYLRFVNMMNDFSSKHKRLLAVANHLASDSPEATQARRLLLNMSDHDPPPTWNHLYQARLMFDLHHPHQLQYSTATGRVSINVQLFTDDDSSKAPDLILQKRKRKLYFGPEESDAFFQKLVQQIACTLPTDLSQKAKYVKFASPSFFSLFNIETTSKSPVMIQHAFNKLKHTTRQAIAKKLLELAIKHTPNDDTVFVLSNADAKKIYNSVMQENRSQKLGNERARRSKKRRSSSYPSATEATEALAQAGIVQAPVRKPKSKRNLDAPAVPNEVQHADVLCDDDDFSLFSDIDQSFDPKNVEHLPGKADITFLQENATHDSLFTFYQDKINVPSPLLNDKKVGFFENNTEVQEAAAECRPVPSPPSIREYHRLDKLFVEHLMTARTTTSPEEFDRVACALPLRSVDDYPLSPTTALPSPSQKNTDADHQTIIHYITLPPIHHRKRSRPNKHAVAEDLIGPVVCTVDSAVSPTFKEEIIVSINDSLFAKGVGGQQKIYLRVATCDERCENTPFHIGCHLYQIVKANAVERKIIAGVNKFLFGQHEFETGATNGANELYLTRVNTVQITVERIEPASGYGKHSDAGDLLNTPGQMHNASPSVLQCHDRLPFKEEMQTVTIVLTTLPSHIESTATHELSFWNSSDKPMGKLATRGNTMHFQMHGTQLYRHQITMIKGISDGEAKGHVRIVISCRLTRPMELGEAEKLTKAKLLPPGLYKFTNVLAAIQNFQLPTTVKHSCSTTDTPKTQMLTYARRANNKTNIDAAANPSYSHSSQSSDNDSTPKHVDAYNSTNDDYQSESSLSRSTTRFYDLPKQERDDFLNSMSTASSVALSRSTEDSLESAGNADTGSLGEVGLINVPKSAFNDSFPNPPRHERSRFKDLHRANTNMVGYNDDAWKFLLRGDVCGPMLLRHQVIPSANHSSGRTLSSLFRLPCHGDRKELRLLRPCGIFSMDIVSSSSGIRHYNRSNPPTTGDHKTTNAIILSRPYKNEVSVINKLLKQLAIIMPSIQSHEHGTTRIEHPDEELADITVYGSGGSSTAAGTYGNQAIAKKSKDDPTSFTPTPQNSSSSKQNRTMCDLAERQASVAVFVDLDKLKPFLDTVIIQNLLLEDEDNNEARGSPALFLGYYYFHAYTYAASTEVELETFNKHVSDSKPANTRSFLDFSSFRNEPHFRFHLRPIFSNATLISRYIEIDNQHAERRKQIPEVFFSSDTFKGPTAKTNCEAPIHTTNASLLRIAHLRNASFIECFLSQFPDVRHNHRSHNSYAIDGYYAKATVVSPANTISRLELMQHLVLTNIAGCIRVLEHNVVPTTRGGPDYCIPIPVSYRLPAMYRAHPMPMPIRTYDVMPLRLLQCAVEMQILQCTNEILKRSCDPVDKGLFFMSIYNRFTGRHGPADVHRHVFPDRRSVSLPLPNQVAHLLAFVREHGCISMLFSPQHADAVPFQLKKNADILLAFFLRVAKSLDSAPNCVFDRTTESMPSISRVDVVEWLQDLLAEAYEAVKNHLSDRASDSFTKTRFMAHLIIADLEEIYDSPFGEVTIESLQVGSGATEGVNLYCCYKSPESMCNIEHVHKDIVSFLAGNDETSGDESVLSGEERKNLARLLGCRLSSNDGQCYVELNSRPLCLTDTEHFMCKLYIGVSKTLPGRSTSRCPRFSKVGHHPLKKNRKGPLPSAILRGTNCRKPIIALPQ